MRTTLVAIGLGLLGWAAAVAAVPQDKAPALPGRSAVLNLRDCMDKTRNTWIFDIQQELQKQQEADAGRATDLNPQERQRIRTKNLEASNRKLLEVYTEIVRLSGVLARERGFDLVQRGDRMPALDAADADLLGQMERRSLMYYAPDVDLTPAVLERLNQDYAARKK
ncbi:MAG TPA: hypothetical protein VKW04_13075 [Planctomycetota bacterium]|nr:hypothetical protein [Planctomycetota bacterium]